jgi:hypothetical protein
VRERKLCLVSRCQALERDPDETVIILPLSVGPNKVNVDIPPVMKTMCNDCCASVARLYRAMSAHQGAVPANGRIKHAGFPVIARKDAAQVRWYSSRAACTSGYSSVWKRQCR